MEDYRSFRRLAVMLLALAELAERAGGACLLVRCLVLWALRPAEAAARAHTIEAAGFLPVEYRPVDDTHDEASRLAEKLRALAAVFRALALLARRGAPRSQTLVPAPLSIASIIGSPPALPAPRIDTS